MGKSHFLPLNGTTAAVVNMPTQILLADDHQMFREMLKTVLHLKKEKHVVIAEADNGADTLNLFNRYRPDLLLLDYKMPRLGRLSDFCKQVQQRSPTTRILVLSGYSEREIVAEAAIGGAHGYIVKGSSIADLRDAIDTVNAGGIWVDPTLPEDVCQTFCHQKLGRNAKLCHLSRQELKIVSLAAQGMSNREIGLRAHISEKTVKNHLTHIFAKLGVVSRQEAAHALLSCAKFCPDSRKGKPQAKRVAPDFSALFTS